MKIAFITTVLNEEGEVSVFLDSLLKQTKMPDEVVIVDGGSRDKTQEIIRRHRIKKKVKIWLVSKRGNRSEGRNAAIKKSSSDIIAVSDVGCTLNKSWLKNITLPFRDKSIDIVSGFYLPKTYSVFEKALASYTCVMPDKVDKNNFLPSSRSVAFRKSVWRKVGGYPEFLEACEDLEFDRSLKNKGFKFYFEGRAIVYWRQRKNMASAFKQFLSYATGDGQAIFIRPQIIFLFARYVVGILIFSGAIWLKSLPLFFLILLLFLFYIIWSIEKNYKYVKHRRALLYLPALQILSDIAVIIGTSIGLLKRINYSLASGKERSEKWVFL